MRLLKNDSQTDIGRVIGVNANTISQYEHGINEPSFEKLEKLINYFNTDAHTLIYRDIEMQNIETNFKQITGYESTKTDLSARLEDFIGYCMLNVHDFCKLANVPDDVLLKLIQG